MAVPQAAARQGGIRAAWAAADAFPALSAAGFFWSHPEEGLRVAAFGVAARHEGVSPRAVLDVPIDWPEGAPEPPGPWFGAIAFDPARALGAAWDGFAVGRWTLPETLAWSRSGRHYVATFGDGCERRLASALRAAKTQPHPAAPNTARLVVRPGDRERWHALVNRALEEIRAGSLDKVVLARALDVEAEGPLDTGSILARLEERNPGCRTFLLRGDDGSAFLGATPETLCRIQGSTLRTEALAGSARPGAAAELLGSQKDLREHRWVVDHLTFALQGLATDEQHPREPAVRAFANVLHLHTPIRARLLPGRSVADVVAALHPTPAVGGVPAAHALSFLADHEDLDRGLYAGLVGWVGLGRAELAVALRSAVVRGSRARLFAGAGVVEGSSAEAEWAETALKSRALLDALEVSQSPREAFAREGTA